MTNLCRQAREATELTMAGFAKLIGVGRPQVSRWEKTGKWPAIAEGFFHLVIASPAHCISILRIAQGLDTGFAGDGGPPPVRHQHEGPMVDEFGNPMVDGPSPEPDLGFEPGSFDVDVSPDFGEPPDDEPSPEPGLLDDEDVDELVICGLELLSPPALDDPEPEDDGDELDDDPDEVPGFTPSF